MRQMKRRQRSIKKPQYADLEGTATLFEGWTGTNLDTYTDDEDLVFKKGERIQSMIKAWSATMPGSYTIKWTKRRVLQELAISGAHAKIIGGLETVTDELKK